MPVQVLKAHQVDGIRWLFRRTHEEGGLLADDPGLGKTLQVIAVIEALIHSQQVSSVLIVTPASLLTNWDAEFRRWLGGTPHRLRVTHLKKGCPNLDMSTHLKLLVQTEAPEHSIVLVSYEGLYLHGGQLYGGAGVDLLVADEAHCLAHAGKRADAVRRTPSRARLLVTATPLSNSLEEVYELYDLALPGVLNTPSFFRRHFVRPIQAATAEGCGEATRALGEAAAQALAAISAEVRGPARRIVGPRRALFGRGARG